MKEWIAAGLILGLTAGTLNAFQTASKRITAIPDPTILLLFTLNALFFGLITLLATQFAFTKAKANVIVPCYSSASISLAIIIGLVTLNEKIVSAQIVGILMLIIGVIFISAFNKEEESD